MNRYYVILFLLTVCPFLAGRGIQGSDSTKSFDRTGSKTNVIARVAGKEITADDFIKRAEYTIRPRYCRSNYANDKKIILNSLIAEKIIALESANDDALLKNGKFNNYIAGRREQKMRELLAFNEGRKKVALDSVKIKKHLRWQAELIK